VLDRRTCGDCSELDGTTVALDQPFPDDAECPYHPDCRCMVLTTFNEDELPDPATSEGRQTASDQVRGATIPGLMKDF
jgi:uncharacterized protein with gpF-like domain